MENKNALKIEVCECPSFTFNDSVWVLSHELAHFALYYLGYDRDTFAGYVHSAQSRYYAYCPEGDTTDSRCNNLWQKMIGYSRDYKVMKVFPGATSATPPQAKFVNYLSNQNNDYSNQNNNYNFSEEQKFKNLEREKIHQENVLKIQKAKEEREKAKIYNDASEVQTQAYQKLQKLREGVMDAEQSLRKASADTPEQKKVIDKAWDLLKTNQATLTQITNMYEAGDRQFGLENYGSAIFSYNYNDKESKQVGDNLKEISKLLEKVETMKPQTCFLFWCW